MIYYNHKFLLYHPYLHERATHMIKKIHIIYQNKISRTTFLLLETIYQLIKYQDEIIPSCLMPIIFENVSIDYKYYGSIHHQLECYYHQYCMLIDKISVEYAHEPFLFRQELIDYYLYDNRLKELKFSGLIYEYPCYFPKSQATIYKAYYKKADWQSYAKQYTSQKGIEALQTIFHICREHISPWGNIQLHSFSKCLGLDLFKYLSFYPNKENSPKAILLIKQNADINIIKYQNQSYSLQQFIWNNIPLINCEFAIDFSRTQFNKRNELYDWYNQFMQYDFQTNQKNKPYKQMGVMVSPVADKEVVISGNLWDIIPYSSLINMKDENRCVYFELSEYELYDLLYHYFHIFLMKKHDFQNKILFQTLHNQKIDLFISLFQSQLNPCKLKSAEQKAIQKLLSLKKESLPSPSIKMKSILNSIIWEQEEIQLDWWLSSIYNKLPINIYLNIYKCLLVDIYSILHKYPSPFQTKKS